MVVSSSASSATDATTLSSNRRMSGLLSGVDTDSLVKNLTAGIQVKIDKQKQQSQLLSWKQTATRDITTKLTGFQNKYFSYSASSTNILSKNFFNTSSISSSSNLIKVTGDTTAAKSMRVSKVTQLATQTRFNSNHKVSGADPSLTSGYIQNSWKDTAMGDAPLVLNVDGVEYTAKLDGNLSLPTVGQPFNSTGIAATDADVQAAMEKAVNAALKNATYKDSKGNTQTKDLSKQIQFEYGTQSANKFSVKNIDTASHKVKIVDYTLNDKHENLERSSKKLLAGLGLTNTLTEQTLAAKDSFTGSKEGTASNYYSKILTAGSYIKVKFQDGKEHNLQIASNVDLDTSGEADPAKAFQDKLKNALTSAIQQEGLEDDLSVDVSNSGISFTAKGATGLKDKFIITGGSENLMSGFALPQDSTYASSKSGTFTALDTNLYSHKLGDSLAGTTLTVKLNGISKDITFDETQKEQYSTTDKLKTYLQDKMATAFGNVTYVSDGTKILGGTPKVNVDLVDGKLKITTNEAEVDGSNKLSTDASGYYSDGANQTDIFGNKIKLNISDNKYYKVDGGGTEYGEAVTDDALKGAASTTVSKMKLSTSNMSTIELDSSDNSNVLGASGALRVIAGETNRIATNQTLKEVGNKIGLTQLQEEGGAGSGKYGMNINGKNFVFDESTTLAAALSKINSDKDANVTISYSSTNDTMNVISKDYGAQQKIDIKEYQNVSGDGYAAANGGNLAAKLFGAQNTADGYTVVKGEDAQMDVSFDDGHSYQTITRSSNSFAIDGVSFELSGVTDSTVSDTAPIKFTVNTDSDELFTKLKDFIDGYNDAIKEINDKSSEARAKDSSGKHTFAPLTDSQRKSMSETEINDWEAKSKQGILSNDANLKSALNDMRMAMNSIVQSSGFKALSKIGIGTQSYDWASGGKLVINENLLKASLAEDPDAVTELFTNTTDGIGTKLKKALDKNVGTFGGNGVLIAYAGKNTDIKDQSAISSQLTAISAKVKNLKAQLEKEQDRYYKKFTYMEQQISHLNSQSALFAQS